MLGARRAARCGLVLLPRWLLDGGSLQQRWAGAVVVRAPRSALVVVVVVRCRRAGAVLETAGRQVGRAATRLWLAGRRGRARAVLTAVRVVRAVHAVVGWLPLCVQAVSDGVVLAGWLG